MKYNLKILNVLPLTVFFFIILSSGIVLYQLKVDKRIERSLASQLIGKNIPETLIPKENFIEKINNLENLNFEKYHDQIFAVNFFASWCAPCRIEAPIIDELSKILPGKSNNINTYLYWEDNPYIDNEVYDNLWPSVKGGNTKKIILITEVAFENGEILRF